jgi:hypothetical protein
VKFDAVLLGKMRRLEELAVDSGRGLLVFSIVEIASKN